MNVDIVRETMLLRALNDGDAFEDRGTYWVKTDWSRLAYYRGDEKSDDQVGVVDLGSGSFRVWCGSTKVLRMPDLTVGNGDPVTK